MATTAAGVMRKTSYTNSSNKKGSKNPYRNLGRDDFSALLVELEERKQKIISEVGPEHVSVVRFVHSEDHKLKPVVFLSKGKKQLDAKTGSSDRASAAMEKQPDKQIVAAISPSLSITSNDVPGKRISKNISKNPFTNLGLEKFSTVLEELQEEKQKILSSHKSPEEVSNVLFSYSQDNQLKAIVVADKDKKAKVKFYSNSNQHRRTETETILNKKTAADTAADKGEERKNRIVTETKAKQETKEEALHEPTSAVEPKENKDRSALLELNESVEVEIEEFKLEGASEKTRVYAKYAYDFGCAIVILLLVVSYLALYQKYKRAVQLLQQQTRFC